MSKGKMNMYIRTKDSILDYDKIYDARESYTLRSQGTKEEVFDFVYYVRGGIKYANNIEELICEGDLVMAKDYWEPKSKKSHVTIIDSTLLPIKEGTVDELYIKQNNGDWKLVAKRNPELEKGLHL